jgi:hypothetical protein
MGLISLFLKGKILQKLLGGLSRGAQTGRAAGSGLLGRPAGKAVMAAVAALLVKRAFRRK